MNLQEFSFGFDTLLNSFSSNVSITCDEYEKSFFLTEAQEQEVLFLYSGKAGNESFEETEELRRYLAPIVKEANLSPIETSNGNPLGVDSNSKFFTLPEDLWFITFESVTIADEGCSNILDVYPVRQDEYQKLKKNPFRGANDRRALRLDLSEGNVEIVSTKDVASYYIRYLSKLNPIVLIDFNGEVTINGVSEATDCELPDILHQRILERAVMLALRTKGVKTENNENR